MMLFDSILRNGVWLRRRKRWLPCAFAVSVVVALLLTPPFTIVKSTIALTVIALLIAACGIAVRCMAAQSRSKKLEDMIEAAGIYSVIRFPTYLSNMLIMLALTVYLGIVWYMLAIVLIGWLIAEKIIINEENALLNKYGETFTQWAKKTNCLIPNIVNWQSAQKKVCKLTTLRRQSLPIMLTVVGFSMINLLKNIMIDFSFNIGVMWLALLALTVIFHLFARIRKVE